MHSASTAVDVEDTLSGKDFARLRELIYSEAGICLSAEKRTMVEGRLKRRLRALNIESYGQYCAYLFGSKGMKVELVPFIDVVTTNKTDFFRESSHFDYLSQQVLPALTAARPEGRTRLFWSAGCSSGEEPYTLAMVLSEYAAAHPPFRFRILATDISTAVLSKAELGVYSADAAGPVPMPLRRKYFMRSRDPHSAQLRVVPELRQLVEFRRLNFMNANYGIAEKAEAIFCRNVLIYFDRPTQQRILQKLCNHLQPDGFLFVGHSESLHDLDLPVVPVAPALYRRRDAA